MCKKYLLILCLLVLACPIFPSLNTVILKRGESIVGQVIGQNAERIQIKVESGKVLEISKKTILKVLYNEISRKEEEAIRKKEELKLVARLKSEEEKKLQYQKTKEDELEKLRSEKLKNSENETSYTKEKLGLLSSYKIYKAYPNGLLTIASPEASCKPYSKSSDWYILFGAVGLTSPDMAKLLPKDSKSVQFRYETSWLDIGATLFGAILISMTRKTLYVDICEDRNQPKFITEEEVKLEREIETQLKEAEEKEKAKQELEENIRLEVDLRKLERMRGK